jgi:hypothetical protein
LTGPRRKKEGLGEGERKRKKKRESKRERGGMCVVFSVSAGN